MTTPATPEPATGLPADPDRDLVRRAQAGEFAAFEELVGRFQDRVYSLALRILGAAHDAEDAAQQTFLSLIEHIRDFRGESAVAGWILRIAANHALKLLRKRRGLPTVPLTPPESTEGSYAHFRTRTSSPRGATIRPIWRPREIRDLIDRALAELDEKYRVVFVLRDVEGFSVKETADPLSSPSPR